MTINRTKTTTTAGTAAGQSSMEMDRRFFEAFDRTSGQVAAVSFRACGALAIARLVVGEPLRRQDLRIENASTGVDQ
jgi:hypothetical protein